MALRGTDLVLQWMLTVLNEEPCQQVALGCRCHWVLRASAGFANGGIESGT